MAIQLEDGTVVESAAEWLARRGGLHPLAPVAELLESGRCSAECLCAAVESVWDCQCRCNGLWHGGVRDRYAQPNILYGNG